MTDSTVMTPEEEKKLVEDTAIELGKLLHEEVTTFSTKLGEDVQIVTRGNAVSIKRKNKNFVYMTHGKRIPLTISVKENKAWKKLELKMDGGLTALQDAITKSYTEVAPVEKPKS